MVLSLKGDRDLVVTLIADTLGRSKISGNPSTVSSSSQETANFPIN